MMFFDVSLFCQLNFQDSATYGMEMIIQLHNYVMFFNVFIISVVVWFFFEIIAVCKFANGFPTYSFKKENAFFLLVSNIYMKTHNSMKHMATLEILWTLLPMIILICIALPSLSMLYYFSLTFEPSLIIQVIGHQWYWSYELVTNSNFITNYPHEHLVHHKAYFLGSLFETYENVIVFNVPINYDILFENYLTDFMVLFSNNKVEWENFVYRRNTSKLIFDSIMIQEEDLYEGGFRLLEVDAPLYLPVDTTVKLFLSSDDVLHSWAVPSLGIKVDCVPGRLNTVEFKISRSGIFYGQCSEICGTQHGFMPICIVAIPKRCYFM